MCKKNNTSIQIMCKNTYTVLHNLSGWKPCKSFFGDYTENMKKIVGTIWDLSANPNITANPNHFGLAGNSQTSRLISFIFSAYFF